MNPLALVVATGLFLVISLVREALALRAGGAVRPKSHPLVILVGSLLSLVALASLLRSCPPGDSGGWAISFHVGFICLWLILMSRAIAGSSSERGSSG